MRMDQNVKKWMKMNKKKDGKIKKMLNVDENALFLHLVKILKFGLNSEIWFIFWNLVYFLKFGLFSEIWFIS